MSSIIHKTAIPPPHRANVQKPELTAEQQAKEAFVLNHFTAEGYLLPGVEEDKRVLLEEERFFLVSCTTYLQRWAREADGMIDEGVSAEIPASDKMGREGCC